MPRPPPTPSSLLPPGCSLFLNSDAGSQLLINGDLVIDNSGLHAEKEESVSLFLEEGMHFGEVARTAGPWAQSTGGRPCACVAACSRGGTCACFRLLQLGPPLT